jgi:hypothetical protein
MSNERVYENRKTWEPSASRSFSPPYSANPSGVIVRALNSSGADVLPGMVLSIEKFSPNMTLTGTGVPSAVYANTQFEGKAISASTAAVAVVQTRMNTGTADVPSQMGFACMSGHTLAKIKTASNVDGQAGLKCTWKTGDQYLNVDSSGFDIIFHSDTFTDGDDYIWGLISLSLGGGGSFSIVQTTGAGIAGAVTAKVITMNANPADTPNFTQTGDSLDLLYFHL